MKSQPFKFKYVSMSRVARLYSSYIYWRERAKYWFVIAFIIIFIIIIILSLKTKQLTTSPNELSPYHCCLQRCFCNRTNVFDTTQYDYQYSQIYCIDLSNSRFPFRRKRNMFLTRIRPFVDEKFNDYYCFVERVEIGPIIVSRRVFAFIARYRRNRRGFPGNRENGRRGAKNIIRRFWGDEENVRPVFSAAELYGTRRVRKVSSVWPYENR